MEPAHCVSLPQFDVLPSEHPSQSLRFYSISSFPFLYIWICLFLLFLFLPSLLSSPHSLLPVDWLCGDHRNFSWQNVDTFPSEARSGAVVQTCHDSLEEGHDERHKVQNQHA